MKTDEEIREVYMKAETLCDDESNPSQKSYLDGAAQALGWLLGERDHPLMDVDIIGAAVEGA